MPSEHVCKLCQEPVTFELRMISDAEWEEAWCHVEPSDHSPLPVPRDDQSTCDLDGIGLGGVAFVHHVSKFALIFGEDVEVFDTHWMVCRGCEGRLAEDDWDGLLERARGVLRLLKMTEVLDPETDASLRAFHNGFRDHWDGQPGRMTTWP